MKTYHIYYNYHQRHRQHIVEMDDANDHDIAQALYQKATDSIKAYRRHLNGDELIEFDRNWECYFPETDSGDRYAKFSQSLYSKISRIQELGSEDYAYLKDIPPHVCGVEILKTFFVDLLGTTLYYYYNHYHHTHHHYRKRIRRG